MSTTLRKLLEAVFHADSYLKGMIQGPYSPQDYKEAEERYYSAVSALMDWYREMR